MKKRIEFASHPANLCLVRHCVRQFLQGRDFTSKEVELMVLGVDEACTNIIRHAYGLVEDQLISLTLETSPAGAIRFRLRDFGEGFAGPSPQTPAAQGSLRPGGLGMHLIQHAFDQVDYLLKSRGTLLVLTKQARHQDSLASAPAMV